MAMLLICIDQEVSLVLQLWSPEVRHARVWFTLYKVRRDSILLTEVWF